jgi:hypothetical protein
VTRRELISSCSSLILAGCSSAPEPKVEKKKPEPVSGLRALYDMYTHARPWAQDLQVVRLRSIHVDQVAPQPGKAGAWQAVFASPSLGQQRAYTLSTIDASTSLRQGIFADAPNSLGRDAQPFVLAGARIDTPEAWETAIKHSDDYDTKHPGTVITWLLQLSHSRNEPVWQVIWGESEASSAFSIVIEAATGRYLQTIL